MPWSREQLRTVESASFDAVWGGYHPDDVQRLRTRVLTAMRAGLPLDDIDAMALRRVRGKGASPRQVDGLRTVISVWRAITPVADPRPKEEDEHEAAVEYFATHDEPYVWRWSGAQIDAVRDRELPLARRHQTAYDVDDVNRYLDSVIDAMRRGVEIPDPQFARFNSAGMRRGYDPRPVDEFLAELAEMTPRG